MDSISSLYAAHHATCDEAFAEAEAAGTEARWDDAAVLLRRFDTLLRAHLGSEEGTLFPAFEAASGMQGGPVAVMRMEHGHMRALLDRLGTAIAAQDVDEYAGAAETLLVLMQQHNLKEERILYPMCDEALAGDGALLTAVTAELRA